MDIHKYKIKSTGPVTLLIRLNVHSNSYFIGVRGTSLKGAWLFKRVITDLATGDLMRINLPVHPDTVLIVMNPGKIDTIMEAPLKLPLNIPHIKELIPNRPYDLKDVNIAFKRDMNTPGRLYKHEPLMEFNPNKMANYEDGIQKFVQLHEIGHYFFDGEEDADAFAMVEFLKRGYNLSTGLRALTEVLGRTPDNLKRILSIHGLNQYLDREYIANGRA